MALNIENTRILLQGFDFKTLFIEELGWNNPKNKAAFPFQTKEGEFVRKAIAELSGATVYEITNAEGTIPDAKARDIISKEIQKINFEHILIFIDKNRTQTIWRWLKKQDKKNLPREHYFSAGQTGDLFIAKLAGLIVDISEIENDITITDVAKKIQSALDVERVTKQFYRNYQDQFIDFLKLIEGIDNEADRRWYASVILNRLMFIYFLQKKGFIDNNNQDYLYTKLKETKKLAGKNQYYNSFLKVLFFDGFAKAEKLRSGATNKLLGKIKYLNGGLFLKHKIEEKYPNINIPDIAFENLLQSEEPKGLFERFSWSLDDTPGGNDNEINPDVLGYIFEKYINQKAFGAYYTRTEITEYLCEQTVYKLILDAINEEEVDPELLKKAGLDKVPARINYTNIAELLISLDAVTCRKLVYGEKAVLPNLSLLDPACGSGAFLVAAMKTLINVYSAILGKIDFLGDKKLLDWKHQIEQDHPSINYYIKKQIITNNLYGVDIMEEATEIAKLRLFLALVASAQTVEQLEPLPNIDFNIMSGNSLIGLLRVDANQFNKHFQPISSKSAKGKIVEKATLYNQATVQGGLFAGEHAKSYQQLINEKEAAVASYKNAHELGITDLQELRDSIQKQEAEANKILNELLQEEFATLGIKYEQVVWDEAKAKFGKSIKRNLTLDDIKELEPFHWGYEFSEIFRKKNGFDAIITNPPWETFQPNAKEFLMGFSENISKKKMDIKDFEDELQSLMTDKSVREPYLKYNSFFNHTREYYRFSNQYKNQVPIINGKRHGKDVNLYKLFVEQSFNLLKQGGYCGIVIPSGIYSDLGSKKLREMLFKDSKVTGIFCFENRKEIFEGVHRMFKFVVLSFEKGGKTKSIPTAFMRHDVEELQSFPSYGSINISLDFVRKQSPESFSIMEIKNEIDFIIADKLLKFPVVADNDSWSLEFHREFNMTDDAYLFNKRLSKNSLPLFEGKMIFNFTHTLSEPRYWIDEFEGRKAVLGRTLDEGQVLGYQKYRLAYRSIASNTNERTLVATIIPPCFTGNSLNVAENLTNELLLYSTAIFSSFVLDWFLRQQVTTNINMFYIYQLPVPRLTSKDKWYKSIINRAVKLICTTDEYAELWEEVMKTKWSERNSATNEFERNQLRAELDGIIAHIYGLTEEEFTYILSTFPLVAQPQKVAAHNAYRDVMNGTLKS
ncbi:MAG: Eco57I restriction-modification methylase domain-containing protein [Bacteroidetes bacterium]|nr:Eco57I restriction-modification methylase domain-containing protein [Bacteroidota bacterium]